MALLPFSPMGGGAGGAQITVGDVKVSVKSSDHSGWILLNGRSVNSLTENQKTAAQNLGFTVALPDMDGRCLVGAGDGFPVSQVGGQPKIPQAALPNVTLTGSAASSGDHAHSAGTLANSSVGDHGHAAGSLANSTAGNHQHTYNMSNGAKPADGTQGTVSVSEVNVSSSTGFAGDHTHTISGNTGLAGSHTHTISGSTQTTGAHTHTVTTSSINGNVTQADYLPPYLALSMFIYLGV